MRNSKSKSQTPTPAAGVKSVIATRARGRRESQHALSEIAARAPSPRRNDLAPKFRFETRALDSLRPAPRQVRRREAKQSAKLQASIEKYGLCRPILIDADGTIVEGHGLWEVAKALGVSEVPCVIIDHLDKNELRKLRIALNRLGETGAWDPQALRLEFEELIDLGFDLVETGFETAEIDGLMLLDDEGGGTDEAPAPQPLATSVSHLGDIWVMGDHRLAHGDARDAALYDRLMTDSEVAQLVLTDEPYNVANVGHVTSNADHREFAFAHGEMSRDEFERFNEQWMAAAVARLTAGGLLATFIDWRSIELVIACGLGLGLNLLNVVVWVKSNGGQGSVWRSRHEFVPFFKKGGEPHVNNVELGRHGRWRSNVWECAGASSLGSDSREGLALHPTTKPRMLLEDALLDVTNRDDIVIDCFAGSGTTLVAAEATGRRCRAIEFDGPYCDVIIRRWSEMTGREAVLEATAETFGEVEARRRSEEPPDPAPQSAHADGAVAPEEAGARADDDQGGATMRQEEVRRERR